MFDFHRIPDTYELIRTEDLPEVSSIGAILRHRKTGARVAVLANEDENKVFNIGFRTPPTDSTGVAHITEHSVLCGSERFSGQGSLRGADEGVSEYFSERHDLSG